MTGADVFGWNRRHSRRAESTTRMAMRRWEAFCISHLIHWFFYTTLAQSGYAACQVVFFHICKYCWKAINLRTRCVVCCDVSKESANSWIQNRLAVVCMKGNGLSFLDFELSSAPTIPQNTKRIGIFAFCMFGGDTKTPSLSDVIVILDDM